MVCGRPFDEKKQACKINHKPWPTEGVLVVERCETICEFCGTSFQSGWFTRRHVRDVHCKHSHPYLTVSDGWTGKPEGNRRPQTAKKRAETPAPTYHTHFAPSTPPQQLLPTFVPNAPLTPPEQLISLFPELDGYNPNFSFENELMGTYGSDVGSSVSPFSGSPAPELTADDIFDFDMGAAVPVDNGSINPEVLGRPSVYDSTSPWSTPQSVRTDSSAVDPQTPLPVQADIMRKALNDALRTIRESGVMTDGQMLKSAQQFLQNFQMGTEF